MRLIDADALGAWFSENFDYNYKIDNREIHEAIDNAPTVEPKKGKWEVQQGSDMVEDGMVCLCCGRYIHDFLPLPSDVCTLEFEQILVSDFKYCPNCGAEMEKEKE